MAIAALRPRFLGSRTLEEKNVEKFNFRTSSAAVRDKMGLTGWIQKYARDLDEKLVEAYKRAEDDPNALDFELPIHQARIPDGKEGEKVVKMLNDLFASAIVEDQEDEGLDVIVIFDRKNNEADAYDKVGYESLMSKQRGDAN